ncbi:MAG: ion transporter [Candidatus Lernaella stagnicola]|nr:ion transporter [Candidatus Lernaella stagnicola]
MAQTPPNQRKSWTIRTQSEEKPPSPWRARLHEIIFEADTPLGKAFDILLFILIILSVFAVMLESVSWLRADYGRILYLIEWAFTILFTIEFILRLICVRRPSAYATSFFGVVDLLAVLPTYLSLVIAGTQTLLIIRVLRLLRVFRVFKLTRYLGEARLLTTALKASRHKIVVFLWTVLTAVIIMGSLMYLVEGEASGFTSIPRGVYWAVVTMTTVGYGDIAPQTILGQTIAAFIMILGYAIIAVPTGIVSAELIQHVKTQTNTQACPNCSAEGHDDDADYCKFCGSKL